MSAPAPAVAPPAPPTTGDAIPVVRAIAFGDPGAEQLDPPTTAAPDTVPNAPSDRGLDTTTNPSTAPTSTTGGPQDSYRPDSYNRYFFDAFLPPYEQTAALCGMRFLPPLMLHGAHKATEADIAAHAASYAKQLAAYPQWPELDELEQCVDCVVPLTARPMENVVEAVA